MFNTHLELPNFSWKSLLQKNYQLLLFSFIFILFYIHPENFKLFFVTNCLIFAILLYFLKNFFYCLYSLFFINLFFLTPGKYYSFEVLPAGYVYKEPFFSQGLIDGYGFLISDFLSIAMIFWFVREVITDQKSVFLKIIKNNLTVLLSFAIFFLVLTYSSLIVSLFPTFSLVNTLQYGKILTVFLSTLWLLSQYKNSGKKIFSQLILACLLVNTILGTYQVFSSLVHIAEPKEQTAQLEDQLVFGRPTGLFLHSNEFALIILLFLVIMPKTNSWIKKFTYIGGVVPIVFSQSRSVWLAIIIAYCLLLFLSIQMQKNTYTFIKNIWNYLRKSPFAIFFLLIIIVGVVFPRLYSARYTFQEGSGSIRLDMLRDGWTLLQFSPVYGFGANTNVLVAFFYLRGSYIREFPYAIHFGYLQLALEAGLLGAFFFFWPFFNLLITNLRLLMRLKNQFPYLKNIFIIICLFIYFLFQPHAGRFEIPILGIILGAIVYTTDYEKSAI